MDSSTTVAAPRPAAFAAPTETGDLVVRARGVGRAVRGRTLLSAVDLDLFAGELVAIAGPSGAGKTTLLSTLAGLHPPTAGSVERTRPGPVGFVPQEDIIHRDLPLRATLRYAARLRRPGADRATVARLTEDALSIVDLRDHGDVRVGSLSGGQRTRASIAVELLAEPEICFLDEPTSGLDPVSAAGVVRRLRALAARGLTVVMTTHDPAQLDAADRVVLLAAGGRLAFAGTPAAARSTFGVAELVDVYDQLGGCDEDRHVVASQAHPTPAPAPPARERAVVPVALDDRSRSRPDRPRWQAGATAALRWAVLTERTAALLVANRLTLAVLVGSPVLVIAMMTLLFPAGAFDDPAIAPAMAPQVLFWMAFAGFFFGLTYGLLQIVTERDIQRRERSSGITPTTYLLAKLGVLVPMLALVCAALLAVLARTDRLPPMDATTIGLVLATLVLEATAALALGMLASAAVRDPAQATLALPMLCFPQVLFAGAIVPVGSMSGLAEALSAPLATRWAFEAIGRSVPTTAATEPWWATFPQVFTGDPVAGLAVLGASALVCLAITRRLLMR